VPNLGLYFGIFKRTLLMNICLAGPSSRQEETLELAVSIHQNIKIAPM
jgi:hypothetical protein